MLKTEKPEKTFVQREKQEQWSRNMTRHYRLEEWEGNNKIQYGVASGRVDIR